MKTPLIFFLAAPALISISCVKNSKGPIKAGYEAPIQERRDLPAASLTAGRGLFLKNCAHCHGADGHGDEGPDLHDLDWTDEQIANRILNGKKGQMTAFAGKLQPPEIESLIIYLRTLK